MLCINLLEAPFPSVDNCLSYDMWRIRGKIVRTVLCCVSRIYAQSYEQFLQVNQGLLV